VEIFVEAGAKSHGENDDSSEAQERPDHAADPGDPFGPRSLGETSATGGQRELLSDNAAILIRPTTSGIGYVLRWTLHYLERWIYDFEKVPPCST
jgi:hypothetical protein